MKTCALVLLTWLIAIALSQGAGVSDDKARNVPKEKIPISRLIEQLGDEDGQVREAATRELIEREDALPALKEALKSSNLEVRRRAERIIEEIRLKPAKKKRQPMLDLAKTGQVDLHVDRMMVDSEFVDATVWDSINTLTQKLIAGAKKAYGKEIPFPEVDKFRWKWLTSTRNPDQLGPEPILSDLRLLAPRITKRTLVLRCKIVSTGSVHCDEMFHDNIVLANGDVTVTNLCGGGASIMNCVVYCDGNITADIVGESILVATGTVKINNDPPELAKLVKHGIIIEHAREPLGLIKFFDPKQVGIEVDAVGDGVAVKKVLDGQTFAKAEFKEGDRVLAVCGTNIESPEQFRRLVRRSAASGKDTMFKVRRGDRTLELTVTLSVP